jgi:DNA-binding winged helix-turn-helix (wHTH) protein
MKAGVHTCPQCGQSLYAVRFGVRLRPIWLHIVDAIVRAGPDGIMRKDLAAQIYREEKATPNTISVHIHHINSALASTDYRIKGGTGRGYRIVKDEQGEQDE